METIGYLGFSKFLIEREEEVREIEGGKNIFDKKDCVMRKFVIFKFQHVYPFFKKKKAYTKKIGVCHWKRPKLLGSGHKFLAGLVT